MLRFVDLRHADIAGANFAFFNTVNDRFIELGGEQSWDTWAEFVETWQEFATDGQKQHDFARFQQLMPDNLMLDPLSLTGPRGARVMSETNNVQPFTEYALSGLQKQRCKVCWNADGFDFHVPDDIWEAVLPKLLRNRVVCLSCFDRFAYERNINYVDHLAVDLHFAGRQGVLTLAIKSRVAGPFEGMPT